MSFRESDAAAIETYKRLHFGSPGGDFLPRTLRAGDPTRGTLTYFGELLHVRYRATKRGDPPNSIYEHDFDARRLPLLCVTNPERLLVIAGGAYRVTWRGIEG